MLVHLIQTLDIQTFLQHILSSFPLSECINPHQFDCLPLMHQKKSLLHHMSFLDLFREALVTMGAVGAITSTEFERLTLHPQIFLKYDIYTPNFYGFLSRKAFLVIYFEEF